MPIGTQDLKFKVLAQVVGNQAIDGLRNSMDNLNKKANVLGQGLKALAGLYSAGKAIEFAKNILDTADNLNDMSQKTGIAVKDLAAFQGAAEQSGLTLEGLAKGLQKLGVNTVEASNGNKELAGTFRALGINIQASGGGLKTAGDLTKELADKFSKLKDGPEKAAIAVKLFGKSGGDMIPFLNEGADALSRFGLAIDQDFASRADQFNDTIAQIGFSIKNGAITSLKALLPTLQEIGKAFLNFTQNGSEAPGLMDAIGETARIMSIGVITGFAAAKQAIDLIVSAVRQGKALLKGDLAEYKQIEREYFARKEKNDLSFFKTVDGLRKNSLIFGEGSVDEIKKRQAAETAPEKRARRTAVADTSALGEKGKGAEKIQDFIQQQRLENEQRKESLNDINLSSVELRKLNEERKFELEVLRASKGLTSDQIVELKKLSDEVIEQRIALIDLEEQQKQTWGRGAKEALRDYLESARDTASQVKGLFSNAFHNMEDALVDFVKSGRLDFKKFADDLISDIIRIQVRAVLAQTITGIGSLFIGAASAGSSSTVGSQSAGNGQYATNAAFANGGVMTSYGPVALKKYARGGVANSPQLALFGEGSSPEAYVPLPDGRSIPVTMKGQGGGGDTFNISISAGSESSDGGQNKGKEFAKALSAVVQAEIIQQKRPGGLLA